MTSNTKKTLTIAGIIVFLLLVVGAVVFVIPRLSTTTETIAPTAPESQPAAAEYVGGVACKTDFVIGVAVIPTPTATPTQAPTTITCSKQALDSSSVALTNVVGGQEFTYKIQVNNTGTTAATGINMKDVLSDEMKLTYVSGDTGCNYDSDTKTVECQVDTLAAGANTSKSFKVKVAGDASNGLKIANKCSTTADNVTATAECSVDVTVNGPTPTPTVPGSPTATPTPTRIAQAVDTPTPTTAITADLPSASEPLATPTPRELPSTGISLPTIGAMGGGVIMILLGILLAL